jgi:hypothetical protein
MASAKIQATEPVGGIADRPPLGLGRFGAWVTSQTASPELAVAMERLGYGAIWLGSANGDLRLPGRLTVPRSPRAPEAAISRAPRHVAGRIRRLALACAVAAVRRWWSTTTGQWSAR